MKKLSQNIVYKPNETNMTITGLEAIAVDMTTKNTAANAPLFAEQYARTQRHAIVLATATGMCDAAASVKKYLRSAFEISTVQVKTALGLKFKLF